MKKALYLFLLFLCLTGATYTINTVPSDDANFLANLQSFLKDEDAARNNHRFSGVIIYGGYHTDPGATLTATISDCVGYPDGYYVSESSVSHTYTASKHTYVFLDADDSIARTFPTCSYSRDGHFVFAECGAATNITTPQYLLPLLYVVTDGSEITSVTDYRGGEVAVEGIMQASGQTFDTVMASLDYIGGRVITINDRHALAGNVTVPQGSELDFRDGGLVVLSTHNFITNSPMKDGHSQRFDQSSTGVAKAGAGAAYIARPDWWIDNATPGTTDMTAAIQDANDFFADGDGGIVRFREGDYLISSQITLSNNITLEGMGPRSTTLKYSQTTGTVISAAGYQNYVRDLLIEGPGTGGSEVALYFEDGVYRHQAERVDIRDVGGAGISIDSFDVSLDHVRIYNSGDDCVRIYDSGGAIVIGNASRFTDCVDSAIDHTHGASHSLTLIGSNFESSANGLEAGGNAASPRELVIIGCHFEGNSAYDIYLGAGTESFTMVGSRLGGTATNRGDYGVYFSAGGTAAELSGNFFRDFTDQVNDDNLIRVASGTLLTLSGGNYSDVLGRQIRETDIENYAAGTINIGQNLPIDYDGHVHAPDLTIVGDLDVDMVSTTISGGIINLSDNPGTYQNLGGEGAAADDLVTINGGTQAGQILFLRSSGVATITVKDDDGNILLEGADNDFVMDVSGDQLMLIYGGVNWQEVSRSSSN